MTHEERLALINKPFPQINYVQPRLWAGTIVGEFLLDDASGGRKTHPKPNYDDQVYIFEEDL